MVSVTQRIKAIKQPYGGYVPVKLFSKTDLPKYESDIGTLNQSENLHGSIIGLVVDYLSRVGMGATTLEAFEVSINGARVVNQFEHVVKLLTTMRSLNDDVTIINACQLVGYDQIWRGGINPVNFTGVKHLIPDAHTIHNIRVLIFRTMIFLESHGPLTQDGYTFEGGYSNIVDSGDGDFLTLDTLWDLKVIRGNMTSQMSLQLLMYYLMGKRSIHTVFDSVTRIGIMNPRSNMIYSLNVSEIPDDIIATVESEILGY